MVSLQHCHVCNKKTDGSKDWKPRHLLEVESCRLGYTKILRRDMYQVAPWMRQKDDIDAPDSGRFFKAPSDRMGMGMGDAAFKLQNSMNPNTLDGPDNQDNSRLNTFGDSSLRISGNYALEIQNIMILRSLNIQDAHKPNTFAEFSGDLNNNNLGQQYSRSSGQLELHRFVSSKYYKSRKLVKQNNNPLNILADHNHGILDSNSPDSSYLHSSTPSISSRLSNNAPDLQNSMSLGSLDNNYTSRLDSAGTGNQDIAYGIDNQGTYYPNSSGKNNLGVRNGMDLNGLDVRSAGGLGISSEGNHDLGGSSSLDHRDTYRWDNMHNSDSGVQNSMISIS